MRFYHMLITLGFKPESLKGKSPKQLEKLYIKAQRHIQVEPIYKPRKTRVNHERQALKETFKQQNALRYRKAKKDYDANKPEYARGKGNKYCETYTRDKISGDITRGSAVKMLKI